MRLYLNDFIVNSLTLVYFAMSRTDFHSCTDEAKFFHAKREFNGFILYVQVSISRACRGIRPQI